MNKLKYLAAVAIGIACLGLQHAKADVFTSDLGHGNPDLSGFTGPYGTVTITLVNSTTATVTFTSNTVGGNTYLFGDGSAVALNVNATSFSVSGVSATGPNSQPVLAYTINTLTGIQVDGLGTFNLVFDDVATPNGFQTAASSVSFTLTNISGTWGSAGAVLAFNGAGYDAAAHIFVTLNGGTTNTGFTGYAGETGGNIVPDGGTTVMLLGVALGALGMVRRYLAS